MCTPANPGRGFSEYYFFGAFKMTTLFELSAESRSALGRGASRRLRRENQVPAIIYGGDEPALSISVSHNQLSKALENEAFYSHILTIHLDGKKHQAVLKDLHRHPFKPRILHMDLLRITGKEKITMNVPLHFVGEDKAPGVKIGGGIVSHILTSVEVRCLPSDLPEYIEVDLSNLNIDESIHLSQIKLSQGIELVALLHGDDLSVASIHVPRSASTEDSSSPTASEVPATNVKSDAEKAKNK